MIHLTIDGIPLTVEAGTNVIDAAASVGIKIPQLCYLKDLSPFGGCRMCVVEIDGKKKPVTACTTLCKEGMDVVTHNERLSMYRRGLLKLLMSNHPVDCLTCEGVGGCELQDLCYKYEVKAPFYEGAKSSFAIDAFNPIMIRDQNKCIKCGKCVRVCREVQVTGTYDFVGRGFHSTVTTAFDQSINTDICRMCGQCISVCPSGALVNKQLMGYRPWEVEKVRTTCPFCGTGCNFDLNVVDGKVIGVTPAEDAPINGTQLCVKGRFHTDMIHSEERLTTPLIKEDGVFRRASWEEALTLTAEKLLAIKETYGPDSIAGLSSARCTNEDNFAFQKFMRVAIGTNNVDHCART